MNTTVLATAAHALVHLNSSSFQRCDHSLMLQEGPLHAVAPCTLQIHNTAIYAKDCKVYRTLPSLFLSLDCTRSDLPCTYTHSLVVSLHPFSSVQHTVVQNLLADHCNCRVRTWRIGPGGTALSRSKGAGGGGGGGARAHLVAGG